MALKPCVIAFATTPLALAISSFAFSQTSSDRVLEEVLVTAEKRSSDLQDTGISVVTISGDEAVRKGLVSMADMIKDMVGVNIQDVGDGATVNIRGMGYDMPVDVGEGAVAINYDGAVNSSAQAAIFGFYDMDRIEVLRGPQGTLYGRNATAGAVNIITANPSPEKIDGYFIGEAGNYSHRRLEGAINLPLTDTQAVRVAFTDVQRDGYMSTGSGDVDGTAVRAKYAFTPNDDVRLVLSAEHSDLGGISPDINTPAASYDAGDIYFSSRVVPDQDYEFTADRFNGLLEFTAGPGVVTFIPAYTKSDRGGTTFLPFPPPGGLIDYGDDELTQKSAELRYASLPDAKIQWQTGIYYYDRVQDATVGMGPCSGLGCERGATSEAVFGQVTVPFADNLRAIAGIRYSEDESTLQQHNDPAGTPFADASVTFKNTTWKLGLEWDISTDAMGYATAATSTRPGGFNTGVNIESSSFDQEEVTSYELGLKSRWLGDKLQMNGAVFYYDYDNYQTVDAAGDPFLDPANFYVKFFNATTARNYGFELDTIALVADATRLNMSVAYLNATYSSDFELHATPNADPINLKGEPLPRSPEWTVKVGFDHDFRIGDMGVLTAGISARWLDDHKGAAIPTEVSLIDAYTVVDANASYLPNEGDWSINFWLKNAADETYKLGASTNDVQAGPPRMYGASIRYDF